ncbi:MAG: cation:proton antiporter [Thermoplasmata archaeon]|nr:cation:proton antiporter [Thermoplasmata archaeon]RLF27502.1 MAG: cation:proton antiporter [Thermoplasmata archaeon]
MLLEIALALILAKTLGYLFEKIRQPAVIGEILTGVLLGPYILGRFSDINLSLFGNEIFHVTINLESTDFEALATLGIITLLFLSGLETKFDDIKNAGRGGMVTSILDVSIAFLFGYLVGHILGFPTLQSLAIGAILTATSVGISVRTLMDMGKLATRSGTLILTVAVLDDVLGILVLSMIIGKGSPIVIGIKAVVFFVVIIFLGLHFIPKVMKIGDIIHARQILLTAALVLCFLFAALAESVGLAAITGAFLAGLLIGTTPQSKRILDFTKDIGYSFLIPLFFVWIGASFDFSAVGNVGLLVLLFIPAALAGKIIGCSTGAKISGLTNREAMQVGLGMIPRMEVALVVVATEISLGIFQGEAAHQMLAATILLVIVTAVLTPTLLKIAYKEK